MPMKIAGIAGTPLCTASFVITIIPNAITAPQERSMPAVRMISVCRDREHADLDDLLQDQ